MSVFRTIGEQFGALVIKNALVAWRNRRATAVRFLAPLFFLLLALAIDEALKADTSNDTVFQNVPNPASVAMSKPIPQCSQDLYIGNKPCIELIYTPNNIITQMIMGNVTSRNANPISAVAYPSRAEANTFMLNNPDYVIGAVHFVFGNVTVPNTLPPLEGFIIQTNSTVKQFKATVQNPNEFIQLPLQSAVHREIARWRLNQDVATQSIAANLGWYIGLKPFPHPTLTTISVVGNVLGPFVFAACMFSFVTQIATVVMEKELGLRPAMRTMGLRDSAYWSSWAVWELFQAFITGNAITIMGIILHFDLFLNNSYGLLFFLFFLFQLAMSSFALMCSTFMQRTQTAVYLGFLVFIVGWIMQTVVIFGVPYTPTYWTTSPIGVILTIAFSAFPWDLLMKGFQDLGAATINSDYPGLRWSERTSYCQNIDNIQEQKAWAAANNIDINSQYVSYKCVMPLSMIYGILVILWVGYLVLAIYLDNVLKNEFGVRRPLFYFFYPSYWNPSTSNASQALAHVTKEDSMGPDDALLKDEDVMAEESRMRQLLQHRTGSNAKEGELAGYVDTRNAIEVFGLKKKFGGSDGCCGRSLLCCSAFDCCSCKAVPSFWPIKGSWLAIEENQLFCLLGPNGAGKTTTINCLIGALPPTYGDALIYGQSIRSTGGMDKIRSVMGVCPQFDVLWPELSGIEHLMLYGRIKGCGWSKVKMEATNLLEKVKLTYAGTQRSGAYSGGMKRRLSVAIALLGDPKVVYLDEPTTGMDPISRRYVWDIIQQAKVGRAIVLTTHSMEEADILGDRIAIMALGRLRCLGSSLRLKQRFGSGYQVSVSVQPGTGMETDLPVLAERAAVVNGLFKQQLGLEPSDEGKVYTTFLVPRNRESDLIPFLASLEKNAQDLGLTDIQLSLTSLEEVFLSVAKSAALEAAQANGNRGLRKKDLHFCITCLKACLLAVTCPISIWGVCWWPRFMVGKDKESGPVATLPDGSELPVAPGQEYVQDANGNNYNVIWGVDDTGHLVVQETKLMEAGMLPPQGSAQLLQARPTYAAVNGKARVPLPGNVLMEVAVGNTYVMNPVDGATYLITWGKDGLGQDAVLSCEPAAAPPAAQLMNATYAASPRGISGSLPPVAPPVNGSGRYAAPADGDATGYNASANGRPASRSSANQASRAVGEGRLLMGEPESLPSPSSQGGMLPNYISTPRDSKPGPSKMAEP